MKTLHEHTCKRCAAVFYREKNGNKYDYCSKSCAFKERLTYEPAKLEQMARAGLKASDIAVALDLRRSSVKLALMRHDFHRVWQMARFKKCRAAA
jgi:hypothetical protein